MGYILCSDISALSVCFVVYILNMANVGGKRECDRLMSHCMGEKWDSYFAVFFIHCTFAVLYLLRIRLMRAASARVGYGCASASVEYGGLLFLVL